MQLAASPLRGNRKPRRESCAWNMQARFIMRIAQPFMAGFSRRMNPKVPSGTTENAPIQFLADAMRVFDKRGIGRKCWIEIKPVRRILTRCCCVLITRFLSSLTGLFRFVRLNPAMNGWAIFGESVFHLCISVALRIRRHECDHCISSEFC